ncbi:hypothetical protein H2200_006082 [Cladophialophora chaetospira]|uniref:C6 transcription factor n=1 Tax=Cladophialophora chaetospira TaxID=386627 RepID=A0AA38XAA1_9EURO|nr:hypothetical protein H2200_006082 [Cladophialophora chaetospira]
MDPIAVYAWKVGIPRLGAEHTAVLGSIMAFGAACLCLDLLLDQGPSEHPGDADELIKTGDRYHQLGLQSVQRQMMLNQPKDITEAYAHSMLLFPYAMAREKISDLIGKRSPSGPSTGLHIESPGHLDWAIVLRGISTTGRAYRAVNSNETDGAINDGMDCQSQKLHHSIASHILAKVSELGGEPGTAGPEPKPILASKHALFPVVSATRVVALETLQRKLESLDQTMRDRHRNAVPAMDGDKVLIRLAQTQSITACSIAVDLLFYLCKMIFDLEQDDISSQPNSCVVDTRLDSFQWLRDYARRGIYSHGGPAYRTIFSWVSTTPDEYFELLKEPIPAQQTRSAAASARQEPAVSWDVEREIRLLAWDIWAHWLVFAILIEHETFWTPNFGTKDITSLAPLFQGSAATPTLGPSKAEAQDWWPGNMCSIALQLQKYNSRGLA